MDVSKWDEGRKMIGYGNFWRDSRKHFWNTDHTSTHAEVQDFISRPSQAEKETYNLKYKPIN